MRFSTYKRNSYKCHIFVHDSVLCHLYADVRWGCLWCSVYRIPDCNFHRQLNDETGYSFDLECSLQSVHNKQKPEKDEQKTQMITLVSVSEGALKKSAIRKCRGFNPGLVARQLLRLGLV